MKLSKFYFFIFINYYNKSVKIFKNVFLSFEMTFLLKWWTEKGIEKFVCLWIIIIRINYYNKSFKIFKIRISFVWNDFLIEMKNWKRNWKIYVPFNNIIIRINYWKVSKFQNSLVPSSFLIERKNKIFDIAFFKFFKNFKIFLLRANKERNSETFDAAFNSVSNLPTIQFELLKNWKISNVFFLRSKEKKE